MGAESFLFSVFDFLFSFFPLVSVPLRGKEGAGPGRELADEFCAEMVSVPLRGKRN